MGDPESTPSLRTGRVFYGWWVLLALCGTTFYIAGSFWWGFSVFFPALLDEFGWSRTQVSLALTIQSAEGIGAAATIGYLVNRVGVRRLMLFGLVTTGLGIILLGQTSSLWWFYSTFVVVSLGTSTAAGIVAQTAVVRWFYRKRGRAVTALMVMPGLGAAVMVPILTVMVQTIGWRGSFTIIGVGVWLLAVPVLLVMRESPEAMGLKPDGAPAPGNYGQEHQGTMVRDQDERSFTVREVLRLRTFWLLAAYFALWNLAGSGIQPHLFVALLGIQMPRPQAALVVSLLPALTIVGRIGFGLLSDFVDKRYLLAVSTLIAAVGLAFLAALMANRDATWLAFPFLGLFAIGFGGSIPTRIAINGQYFGRQHFAFVFGTMQAFSAWGGMVGPLLAGWMFDFTGSYFTFFAISSTLLVISVPFILLASNPQQAALLPQAAQATPELEAKNPVPSARAGAHDRRNSA